LKQVLKFAVDDIKLIQELSDSQLAIAEVKVCHSGMNLHDKPIDIVAMKNATSTLVNKWLVAGFDGWGDFKGHEGKAQLIIGFFPKENDFRYVEEDGKTFFVANAIVSKNYASWAFDVFQKENLKECSMEITVLETEQRDDGYEWITSYIYNAVTVLGHNNSAACPGSDVQIVKFSTEELVEKGEKAYSIWANISSKEEDIVIKEAVEKFSLNSSQIRDILSNALSEYKYQNGDWEGNKYYVNCYDDVYVYVDDNEDYTKTYRMLYNIIDNIAIINVESREDVIRGNFIPVVSAKETGEEEMSSDQHTEATAQAEMNENQAEVNKELTEEGKEEMAEGETSDKFMKMPEDDMKMAEKPMMMSEEEMKAKMNEMKSKMDEMQKQMDEMKSKMEEKMAVYMDENEDLKKFKADIEEKQMMSVIEYTLSEVMESMPKEKMEELREDAKNFSSENVNIWVNKVKAEAFSFSKGQSNTDGITRIGLPFNNEEKKVSNSLWDKI
jgi:hypothetical protein